MRVSFAVTAALSALSLAGVTHAATIPLLTFENDEFVGDAGAAVNYGGVQSTAGVDSASPGFGVTEGTRSLLFNGYIPGGANFFSTTTDGNDTGEALANYRAFQAAAAALTAGHTVTFSFDMAYNFSGVTTAGYFQPGLIFNSDVGGYNGPAYGGLLQGNAQGTGATGGSFPQVGSSPGVSIQILNPVNYSTDFDGIVRVTATVGLPGSNKALILGASSGYYQLNLLSQGGYTGSSNISFDNFVFNDTPLPEPTSLTAIGAASLAVLRRRRRRA